MGSKLLDGKSSWPQSRGSGIMRSLSRVVALLAVLAIIISNLPAQENDKAKGEKKLNLARLEKIGGKLVNPGSDKGKIVLSVPIAVPESNGRRGIRVREQHKDVNLTPDDDMIV